MSQRLDKLTPNIISNNEFEIIAENPTIGNDIHALIPRITTFLREQLEFPSLKMSVKVRELSEQPRILSPREQFKQMQMDNKAFEQLVTELQLSL